MMIIVSFTLQANIDMVSFTLQTKLDIIGLKIEVVSTL